MHDALQHRNERGVASTSRADIVRRESAAGKNDIQAPTCFKVKPVLAKVVTTGGGVSTSHLVPVALHRGHYVNTRHQPDYIAPKKRREA
jgi:hypothetical protein